MNKDEKQPLFVCFNCFVLDYEVYSLGGHHRFEALTKSPLVIQYLIDNNIEYAKMQWSYNVIEIYQLHCNTNHIIQVISSKLWDIYTADEMKQLIPLLQRFDNGLTDSDAVVQTSDIEIAYL